MTAAARRFRSYDETRPRDALAVRLLKRLVVAGLLVHVTLASISGFRAIVQIYRVDVRLPSTALAAGSTVRAAVVTSGRTRATLTVELTQDGRSELLGTRRIPGNWDGVYDPFPRHADLDVTLTPELLARFHRGPARLRVTGLGASQWLRVPPPTVRDVAVTIGGLP